MNTAKPADQAPATKFDQALDKAKKLGGVKAETAEAVSAVKEEKPPKVGAEPEELKNIEVELPDPAKEKKSEEQAMALPEQPKMINGEMVFSQKYMQLVRQQIAKDLTDDEFMMYGMMAKRFRLDPLARQITPVVFSKDDPAKRRVSYVTTIDGLRLIAHRTGEFAGVDEPVFTYSGQQVTHAAITVYKFVQGQRVGFSAKVKFSEYSTGQNLWNTKYGKPETMIAKVAEAHALRKAFPQELSGIYTSDEMEASQENAAKQSVPMITKKQFDKIKQLIELKEVPTEQVKQMASVYKRPSLAKLTQKQAGHFIAELEKLPDPVVEEVQEVVEDEGSFEDFVDSQFDSDQVAEDAFNALG